MTQIETLVEKYRDWLSERTAFRKIGEWTEITTPFLDRHNDYIQIYVRKNENQITLTDDGSTIQDLELSGCVLDTQKRKEIFRLIINGFGVVEKQGALLIHATEESFPVKKHSLIQAILSVNDMFCLAQSTVKSLFLEDIQNWLLDLDVRFVPNVKFSGDSGFDHMFDFAIPMSKDAPERLLRAINRPDKETAQNLIFSWMDTQKIRPADSHAFAILNDTDKKIPSNVISAFGNYDISPILWSERQRYEKKLAA